MDKIISLVLRNCVDGDWDEDYITRSLLSSIRDCFSEIHLEADYKLGRPSVCQIEAYKNRKTKNYEPNYGDIGILVRLNLGNGKILEGVALLEAKRIYTPDDGLDDVKFPYFKALELSQLTKHVANTSNHRTVLYDFYTKSEGSKVVYSVQTLPSQHLIVADVNDRSIYSLTEDFSYCLAHRYMCGYELNYETEIVDGFKGNRGGKAATRFLLELNFHMDEEFERGTNAIGSGINTDIYLPLEPGFLDVTRWYPRLKAA
ncbi:hypothetical protein RAX52_004536 [Vibrio parahaemolyticus]|nr:hypothetical protein [Vibrio parahaemolyticus]ELA7138080.1 hypothetical protein [Vibrio parahaemolyticus]ELP2659015.1 hypothetical protein [Vibrio parahaemolyticus]